MKKYLLFLIFASIFSLTACQQIAKLTNKKEETHSARKIVFVKISSGTFFNLALTKEGVLYAVGRNKYGQLGDGTFKGITTWKPVLKNIKDISAGYAHALALSEDGTLWGTGNNTYGQLGVKKGRRNRNVWIRLLKNIVAISAGDNHSLALDKDGYVYGAGLNKFGQLGIGANKQIKTWKKVFNGCKAVSAGMEHSLALKKDGTLWATGQNEFGQYGIGNVSGKNVWVKVLSGVKSMDCHNSNSSLAIKKNGTLMVTGWNWSKQLGIKKEEPPEDEWFFEEEETPHQFEWAKVMNKVIQASTGKDHCIALKKGGTIWVSGSNEFGQLGTGDNKSRNIWTQIILEEDQVNIATNVNAGTYNSLAITSGGKLWVVGDNYHNQLGVNDKKVSYDWLSVEEISK